METTRETFGDEMPEGLTGEVLGPLGIPLVVQPTRSHSADAANDLAKVAAQHRESFEPLLLRHGAVLFRGFGVLDAASFESCVEALSDRTIEYWDQIALRSPVRGHVYTATDHSPDRSLFLHNEQSYARRWPGRLFFCCARAAQSGGETPLADVRRVLASLDPSLRERFAHRGVMYTRNFRGGPIGLSWQRAFQTEDREVMERSCREAGIEVEWRGDDAVRTRQVRPAIARHPATGEDVWFNHVATLHPSTLPAGRAAALAKLFREEDLPNRVTYGDGSPIEPSDLDEIRAAYAAHSVALPWQDGDVLMVDNLLAAHGRNPYRGEREVLVAMADPRLWDDVRIGASA